MSDRLGFNNGSVFLSALGSFWVKIFEDREIFKVIANSQNFKISDLYFRVCEIILGQSINDIPVFSRETWKNVTFLESKINEGVGNVFRYGDEDLSYGDPDVVYGGVYTDGRVSFPLPEDIVDTGGFITNKIYAPSLILLKGRDYNIRNRVITFSSNIFDNESVPIRDVYDLDGNIVDREISLWIPRVYIDKEDLYNNFGVLLDIKQDSSLEYKTLLRTIFALYTSGPKRRFVIGFLNAVFNFPIILEKEETVSSIVSDEEGTRLLTDRNIYNLEYPEDVAPNVFPGAVLEMFTPIYDIVDVTTVEENRTFITNRDVFVIPSGLLSAEIGKSLTISRKKIRIDKRIGQEPVFIDPLTSDELVIAEKINQMIGLSPNDIGEPFFDLDLLEFVADQVKSNIVNIVIKNTKANSTLFTPRLQEIFKSVLPVFLTYIISSQLDEPVVDTYDTSTSTDSIELRTGAALSDVIVSGQEVLDGFYGFAQIGIGDIIIGQDNILIGQRRMFPLVSTFLR